MRCRLRVGSRSRGLEIGFDVDDNVEMLSDHELVLPEHVVPGDPEILPVQGSSRLEAHRRVGAGLVGILVGAEARGMQKDGPRRAPYREIPVKLEEVAPGGLGLRAPEEDGRVRLRVQGNRVRLELSPDEWPAFLAPEVRGPFSAYLAALGFGGLSLDGTAK